MAIPIGDSFGRSTAKPLDASSVVADVTARNAIASGIRYEGLKVYVVADQKTYILKGGITNSDWADDGGGSGSGVQSVADVAARNAIPEASRTPGMLVHIVSGDSIYKLIGSPSGATTTTADWDALITWSMYRTVVSNTQTLTGGGSITRTGRRVERVKVQGTSGETSVTIGNSPTPFDGDQLFIQGMSDDNPIIVGPFYLTAGQIGHLMYDSATTSWIKVGGV